MLKHLLFIFLFCLLLVNVQGQGFNPTSPDNTIMDQEYFEALQFTLSEAYPNPADSETKLDFKLPKDTQKAKIIIRSLLGFVMSEHLIEGLSGTMAIQTSDLTGGLYFYSLMIDGDIRITRKLIIKH
jgi:hypothetical protein